MLGKSELSVAIKFKFKLQLESFPLRRVRVGIRTASVRPARDLFLLLMDPITNSNSFSTLEVHLDGVDSPGSSVFDLPIQNTISARSNPRLEIRPPAIDTLTELRDTTAHEPKFLGSNSFVLVSGGTGGNAICTAFPNACYVLPVSDDGGSSSEIIRVLGGPSVGTIIVFLTYTLNAKSLIVVERRYSE